MAEEISLWLNLCFMEKTLRKSENDNSIQVIDIFAKPATNKGDNYASDMIRVNVEYSRDQNGHKILEKKSVIVKVEPTLEGVRKKIEPNQKQMYSRGMFNSEHPPEMRGFFVLGTKQLAEEMTNWQGMKRYSEKIAKMADHIYQIGIEACKFSEDDFNVINHGDCWVNNMMFKYDDDGKPIDHIFVDFQLCVYTSPAVDLLYFLSNSPSPDVLENNKHILFNEYIGTLSATMKQLDCKTQPLTAEELKAALKRRASYGIISSFTVLPLLLIDKEEVKDLDEMMSKNGYTNPGYKNEAYKKIMMKRVPMYDKWGLLDL